MMLGQEDYVLGEESEHAGTERVNTLHPLTAELWTLIRTKKMSVAQQSHH